MPRPVGETMATLRIPHRLMNDLEVQALTALPEECCGALLGRCESGESERTRLVTSLWPTQNVHAGPRSSGYAIDPEELLRVHKMARQRDQEVVGYYHSHPDGGAAPSSRDLAEAGPGVSYLIMAVSNGQVAECRSWRLRSDSEGFEEERMVLRYSS